MAISKVNDNYISVQLRHTRYAIKIGRNGKKNFVFFPSPHQSLIKTLDYFSLKCTHFNTVPYLSITGTLDKKLCFNSGFASTSV